MLLPVEQQHQKLLIDNYSGESREREIRPGETMHFRKILGLGKREKIYPHTAAFSRFPAQCVEDPHERVQFKSSHCISADSIHFKVSHSHL